MDTKPDLLAEDQEFPIDHINGGYLIETANWAKFIAITFFILCAGLFILLFIQGNDIISLRRLNRVNSLSDQMWIVILICTVTGVIVGVTYYFLFDFGNKVKQGILSLDIETVNKGLNSLRIHQMIIGILLMLGLLLAIVNLIRI